MQTITFIGYWISNSILILITSQLANKGIVLGNQHVSPIWASVFAGYILSTINILTNPTLRLLKITLKKQWQKIWLVIVINSLSLWIITRLALIIGLGIWAFWWAIILGIILGLGQWLVNSLTEK